MPYWTTRGLRGSALEEMINMTNQQYMQRGIAVMQKVPTPITPVEVNNATRTISLAYFEKKSTVDYIGVAQGIALCFDAKETQGKNLPLRNIHEHQMEFMEAFTEQSGISFLLVNFIALGETFFLPFGELKIHYARKKNGGRKSIPYEAFEKKYLVFNKGGFPVHYLEAVNTFLASNR